MVTTNIGEIDESLKKIVAREILVEDSLWYGQHSDQKESQKFASFQQK